MASIIAGIAKTAELICWASEKTEVSRHITEYKRHFSLVNSQPI